MLCCILSHGVRLYILIVAVSQLIKQKKEDYCKSGNFDSGTFDESGQITKL